ncbi:ABC transporter permease subunit [Rhizobium sp. CF142]|uniref:ABC transporter permease subunit n=1 Tax=Rhizobium sp. CF142 TaxID=1144314 RepID=UPI00026F007B|nr:ABC transporter permease subunit [Rhizobium sp. CF142]EJJ29892.1 ABC-type nitrate/sulfonate/bicarbonate transport system, permease component [Rhizobium sp. CF142]
MSVEAEALATRVPDQPVEARPKRRGTLPISLATIAVIIAGWSLASAYGAVSPVFLPSPLVVAKSLANVAVNGFVDSTLAEHTLASLLRIFAALAVSLIIGVPAGLAIATSRIGKGILDPIVEFLRPLPPLAYLPLIIIWVGIGEASKVTVISLAMLPPIILSTASGVKSAPGDFVNAARSFGASRLQVLLHVILPGAIPSILTGTRIALGAGWSTLVAAELVAASQGLGFMIQSAAQFLVTDIVIGGIIVIAAIAFLLEILARLIERVFVPWAAHR